MRQYNRRVKIAGLSLLILPPLFIFGLWTWFTWDSHPDYTRFVNAVDENNYSSVVSQMRNGTSPNLLYIEGGEGYDMAPICFAVQNRNIKMVKLLLDHGANINIDDGWNQTPLSVAASNDDIPMLKYLLSRGAVVNDDSGNNSRALWGAAVGTKIDPEAVKLLLDHGANPNTTEQNEPVLHAVESFSNGEKEAGSTEVIKLLRHAGAKDATSAKLPK